MTLRSYCANKRKDRREAPPVHKTETCQKMRRSNMEQSVWWKEPMRVMQYNLQVRDTPGMDPEKIARETEAVSYTHLARGSAWPGPWRWIRSSSSVMSRYLPSMSRFRPRSSTCSWIYRRKRICPTCLSPMTSVSFAISATTSRLCRCV